jgi:hypothetical protein
MRLTTPAACETLLYQQLTRLFHYKIILKFPLHFSIYDMTNQGDEALCLVFPGWSGQIPVSKRFIKWTEDRRNAFIKGQGTGEMRLTLILFDRLMNI